MSKIRLNFLCFCVRTVIKPYNCRTKRSKIFICNYQSFTLSIYRKSGYNLRQLIFIAVGKCNSSGFSKRIFLQLKYIQEHQIRQGFPLYREYNQSLTKKPYFRLYQNCGFQRRSSYINPDQIFFSVCHIHHIRYALCFSSHARAERESSLQPLRGHPREKYRLYCLSPPHRA